MSEEVKRGTIVVVDNERTSYVTHVTPSGRIRIEGFGDEYRPMEHKGHWRHTGRPEGRFGWRGFSHARLATPDEIERYRQERRASALRPRITEALRIADPSVVFQVAAILGIEKGEPTP